MTLRRDDTISAVVTHRPITRIAYSVAALRNTATEYAIHGMAKKKNPQPNILSKDDPNLLEGVKRLDRAQKTFGWMLIGYGLLTQIIALLNEPLHPVAGLPFIGVGLFCLGWGDPALLATAATLLALSIVPTVNPRLSLLGPDPIVTMTGSGGLEIFALIAAKVLLAYYSLSQFLQFRLLYGTERAVSDEPNLAIIPEMVPNRTNLYARWARSTAILGGVIALIAVGFLISDPLAVGTRVMAETSGALGAMALGLGFGAAFAPTDERPAALIGMGAGLAGYAVAGAVLLLIV